MWTRFMDMSSGGSRKEDFAYCFIEAPENEAKIIFYNMFGHNPERVTCTCCGEDYSISEYSTLEQASAYERGCDFDNESNCWIEAPNKDRAWKEYQTLEEWSKSPFIKIIRSNEIKSSDKIGEVPQQGFVWID